MRTVWVVLAGLLLGSVGVLAREGGGADEAQVLLPLTLGIRAQESETEGVGDVLIPLWRGPRSMLLANIRAAASDHDEEELNIGVGVRHLVEARVPFMVGGFVFYDGRWTKHHNRFDQLGLSAEFLSDWVDARFNYYLPNHDTALVDRQEVESVVESRRVTESAESAWGEPYGRVHSIVQDRVTTWTRQERWTRETTTHLFENWEAALEGWDAEIGVRLPLCERFFETRVFGGYQYFDHPFGGHLKGAQGRIELRALEGRLLLDAQVFENRELNLSDWRAGVRMRLPFELSALAQKRNPFALPKGEGRTDLRWRFDEMLMRDPKIQIQKSGYVEDAAKRAVEKKSETKTQRRRETETAVLADGVTFVNADRGDDANPGTAESPKGTVQGGVDGAQASSRLYTMAWPDGGQRRLVYVESASVPYGELELTVPGIGLLGSGVAMPGFGGKSFGGGAGPRMELADTPGVWVREAGAGAGVAGFAFGGTGGLATGVRSDSGRVVVWGNEFRDLTRGAAMYTTDADVNSWVVGNRFSGTGRAVHVGAQGTGDGVFRLRVEGNVMTAGEQGAYVTAVDYQNGQVVLARNELRDLWGAGLQVGVNIGVAGGGVAYVDVLDNLLNGVGNVEEEDAIRVAGETGLSRGVYRVEGNRVAGAYGGIRVEAGGEERVSILADGNRILNIAQAGIVAVAQARGEGFAGVGAVGNRVSNVGDEGIRLTALAEDGNAYLSTEGNRVTGAGGAGLYLAAYSASHFSSVSAEENTLIGNEYGLLASARSDAYTAVMEMMGNTVLNSVQGGMGLNLSSGGRNVAAILMGNTASGNGGAGLAFAGSTQGGDILVDAAGNRAEGNGAGGGLSFSMNSHGGNIEFRGRENVVADNAGTGLAVDAMPGGGTANLDVVGNRAIGGDVGIRVDAESEGIVSLLLEGNEVSGSADSGIQVTVRGVEMGDVEVAADRNVTRDTGGVGLWVIAETEDGIANVQALENESSGAGTGMQFRVASENNTAMLGLMGNRVNDNTRGLMASVESSNLFASLWALSNVAESNEAAGIEFDLQGGGLGAIAYLAQNTASGNGGLGIGMTGGSAGVGGLTVVAEDNVTSLNEAGGMRLELATDGGDLDVEVSGNEARGNAGHGLVVEVTPGGGTAEVTVAGNRVEGGGIGIRVAGETEGESGALSFWVEDNEVSGSAAGGISVTATGTETGAVKVVAARNVTRDTGDFGLRLIAETWEALAEIEAVENESSGAATGLDVRAVAGNWAAILGVVSNRVYENSRGIVATASGSNLFTRLLVEDNIAVSNTATGMELDFLGGGWGSWVRVDRNTASWNGGRGIELTGVSIWDMLGVWVEDNQVWGNQGHGMTLDLTAEAGNLGLEVKGNTVGENEANGLGVRVVGASSGTADVVIQGNQAIANRWNGLHLQGNMNGMSGEWLVEGNRVIGNPQLGIAMAGTRGDNVAWHAVGNVVEGNGYGILLNWAVAPMTDDFVLTQNSLANSVFNLVYDASVGLDARGNWWGADPPNGGMIVQDGAGAIDWSQWLTERPDLP